jgi:hypothetical protein
MSMSDAIRNAKREHPELKTKGIVDLLAEQGIKVSYSLAANVLGRMKGKRGRKPGRKPGAGRKAQHAGLNGLSSQLGTAVEFATSVGGLQNAFQLLEALNAIKSQL